MTSSAAIDHTAEVDFAFLRELRAAGEASGADLVGDSLRLFLESTAPRLDALRGALDTGDRQTASLAAHTLRGGCAQFGALRMARLAGFIEDQMRTGITDATRRAALDLQREFSGVRAALLHEFAPHGRDR
jgi:HPt (histidine-containing phosphotransfer) domain-containing protein